MLRLPATKGHPEKCKLIGIRGDCKEWDRISLSQLIYSESVARIPFKDKTIN